MTDSQSNFLWLGHPGLDGGELARRLQRSAVAVVPGASLGDSRFVRASIPGPGESERLLGALTAAVADQS